MPERINVADKKISGWLKRSPGPRFDGGLFLNGSFKNGVEHWINGGGNLTWNSGLKALQADGYVGSLFTEEIPGGTSLAVEFDVDVSLSTAAGYCDIYQYDGDNITNWKKVYYDVVDNAAHVSYTYVMSGDAAVGMYFNFNHDKLCTADNVSCHVL